ncbi:hypothetical protein RKE29_05000 [Streptomyces sp. B1866]|uniref:hypothetical protein n=1 Tax=Streptomyces sp. B1866 TaxID=3075431 RepID=UPI00288EEE74|nr:hypothetical protein [Streptomyces sp. B1866]MDT3396006.1 hypothetical protein [Streptomyces sp. B1866]
MDAWNDLADECLDRAACAERDFRCCLKRMVEPRPCCDCHDCDGRRHDGDCDDRAEHEESRPAVPAEAH